jgi:eukaryotic-like serine/threonine-protein kinase
MKAAQKLDAAQWQQLKPLLTGALRLPSADREAFFAEHLSGDPALQACALEMLRVYDSASKSFSAGSGRITPSGGFPVPPMPELSRGASVGHYRILRRLGEGGMGAVYLAQDTRLGRQAALKFLDPAVTRGGRDGHAAAIAESRSIAVLNHPGIVVLYDVFEHDGELILAMEYVEGRPLSEHLAGPVPTAFALRLIEQVADAVAYAHARGVLHCDLKPSNIHVLPNGAIKILDFGLARLVTAVSPDQHTAPARVMGTAGYLSPEQLCFEPPTAASDVYALGVVSFELLTGARPFETDDQEQLLLETVAAPAPLASSIVSSLPSAVDDTVSRCLAKNPRERLQAHELAQAMRAVQLHETEPVSPLREEESSSQARGVRRRWLLAACAALIAGLAVWAASTNRFGLRWPWRASPPISIGAGPVSLAILPTTGTLQRPEDTALAKAMPALLRPALSRLSGVTVALLDDDRMAADTPPPTAMKKLGATVAVRCVLNTRDGRDSSEIELLSGERAARVFHADISVDARNSGRTLDEVIHALGSGLGIPVPPSPGARGTTAAALVPSALALSHFSEGTEMMERPDVEGNVERAITLLESATEKDPSSALAHAALARAFWMHYVDTRKEEFARKAQASIMTALTLDNSLLPVKLSAADIERGIGENDRAEGMLNDVIASAPASDEAHRLLGEVFAARGQWDRAQQEFDRAIALRPLYWRNHRAKGLAYYNAGDFDKAIGSFTRVTQLQPDSAWGYQMLGVAQHQLGHYQEAVAAYETSVKLGPSAAAWSNIAKLHYDHGQYEKAVAAYREALKIRSASAVTWRNLGDVLAVMGRTGEAKTAYLQAEDLGARVVRVNPSDANALSTLAVIHAKLGRRKDALSEAERATALAPKDRNVEFRFAVVQMLSGDSAGAQASLEKAIGLGYSVSEAKLDRDLRGLKFDNR